MIRVIFVVLGRAPVATERNGTMNGTTCDALAAARALRNAGFEDRQAEAVAGVVRHAVSVDRAGLATRADLEAAIAGLEARIYRAMWVVGLGVVGGVGAVVAAIFAIVTG